jgi:predicted RNase H-like HicB family nuclease
MSLDDDKIVLYRNRPDGWVAEVPAIRGCYALMPTREEAVADIHELHKGATLAGVRITNPINEGRKH